MQRIKRQYTLIALILVVMVAQAQDMHFTQFYASPLYLNPAFTGANACSRVTLTYRNQWPYINKAYKSYMLSGDHFLSQYNLGVGMLVASDVAGTGNLKTTMINPSVAYEAKLGKDFGMRFGLQPGITSQSIDFNKLLFADQIANGTSSSALSLPKPTVTYFDLNAGVLAYSSKYWGGVALSNVNKPNQSLGGSGDASLPVRISVHGGGKFLLNEEEKEVNKMKTIFAAFHYRHQNKFDQLDIGFYYMQSILTLGVWYRGLPLKHYAPGYRNSDAIAIIVGAKADRMYFGYSYDFTISRLMGATRGAHEINVSYQFCVPKKKKKRIEVACPKF